MKPLLLASACLCGVPCRYDGAAKPLPELRPLLARGMVLPFCPEAAGGLPVPRPPCELVGDRVLSKDGADHTDAFRRGAEAALAVARMYGIRTAVLQEGSPSCGKARVHDGTFSGRVRPGQGIAAALLAGAGIRIYGGEEFSALLPLLSDAPDVRT